MEETMNKSTTIKGTGTMALPAFIKSRFPDRYDEWIRALPPASKAVFDSTLLAFEKYSFRDALVTPTQVMIDMFFGGNDHGAWESGFFSASYALKGFYKIFFRFGSPQFIIDRASRVFSSYYEDGEMRVADSSPGRCVLQIVRFPDPHIILDMNVGGWMDGALELMGKKERTVDVTRYMSKGDPVTEFVAAWK
jgi:hypothetical protein